MVGFSMLAHQSVRVALVTLEFIIYQGNLLPGNSIRENLVRGGHRLVVLEICPIASI